MAQLPRIIILLFLALGIGLLVFIVAQGMAILLKNKTSIDSGIPTIDCVRYIYQIQGISTQSGKLTFTVVNLPYSEDIDLITIANTKEKIPVQLSKGTSQLIVAKLPLAQNFSIYPDICSPYKTICSMETGECQSA